MVLRKLLALTAIISSFGSFGFVKGEARWQRIDADGLFRFRLPAGFQKTDMTGVENYLGEYYKGKTRFLFISGDTASNAYDVRRQPEMLGYSERDTTVAGKPANIRTYSQKRDGELVYRAELNVGNWPNAQVELYMELESQQANDLLVADRIFASISFARNTAQSSGVGPNETLAKLFAYDRKKPFALKELSKQEQDGVVVTDVEYASYSAKRGPIKAYIVRPAKPGSFAGVLFFHWLGRPKGDRTQFLEEAISLAKQGTVSLLIQGHFPWKVDPSEGMTDRQLIIDETIEVRRALDLLLSQPMVDRKRIAYVGHDYGAMYGSLAAGIEKRVKTYVLIAGLGTFADWSLEYWLKTKPDDFKKSYVQAMQGLDPISSINRATPAALLFQFANLDTFIKREEALAFYRAASSPKQIKWYQTTHEMDLEAARNDRRDWLTEKLRLRS